MQWSRWFPILESLDQYTRVDFGKDLSAGLTVGVMLIPQGMAYAMLTGMPPIYGLYGGFIPLFLYAIFGSSRQMSIGPVAISALLVLAGISQLEEPGSVAFIELVILTGLLVGLAQLLLSFLRMGFLVNFLSHPVLVGFTSAAAVIIGISQLKDLLGIAIPRFAHSYQTLFYAVEHLGQTQLLSVIFCLGALFAILGFKSIHRSIPGPLIVTIIGTLLAWGFQLESQGLALVREVPEGLPAFEIPVLAWDKIVAVMPTVFTVTVICVVESIGIAKVLEAKHQNYVVRPDQELLALGVSKLIGAFFQSLVTSGSFSRSAVNDEAGAKTGVASIVAATLVGLTLLFLTDLVYFLPKAVLAAIILLAIKSLFDLKEAIHLWHTHRRDFWMMSVTFLVTLVFGIGEGVVAGVTLSLMTVLYRSSRPHLAVLGKLPGTNFYRNIKRFQEAQQSDEILILRFDDQLYFGNASYFKENIKRLVSEKGPNLKLLIMDASSMHDIDSTGIHALEEMYKYLAERKIRLNLCGVIGPVRDMLYRVNLIEDFGKENFFMYVHNAEDAFYHGEQQGDLPWNPSAIQTNVKNRQ
ncbi:MAG: solute carrier family 26 protein [Saprospiraceae bacterium]|nr:solute carrier family 26 protein [Saprospiraceae bacterium]